MATVLLATLLRLHCTEIKHGWRDMNRRLKIYCRLLRLMHSVLSCNGHKKQNVPQMSDADVRKLQIAFTFIFNLENIFYFLLLISTFMR